LQSQAIFLKTPNTSNTIANMNDDGARSLTPDQTEEDISEYSNDHYARFARNQKIKKFVTRTLMALVLVCCSLIFLLLLFVIIFAILLGANVLVNYCSIELRFNGGNQLYIYQKFKEASVRTPFGKYCKISERLGSRIN